MNSGSSAPKGENRLRQGDRGVRITSPLSVSIIGVQIPSEDRQLSRREAEVLALLCRGLTDKEVAAHLGIAMGTIRIYRKRAQHKLNTQGLVQSALVAWKLGQLDLEAIADKLVAECIGRGPEEPGQSRAGLADSASRLTPNFTQETADAPSDCQLA